MLASPPASWRTSFPGASVPFRNRMRRFREKRRYFPKLDSSGGISTVAVRLSLCACWPVKAEDAPLDYPPSRRAGPGNERVAYVGSYGDCKAGRFYRRGRLDRRRCRACGREAEGRQADLCKAWQAYRAASSSCSTASAQAASAASGDRASGAGSRSAATAAPATANAECRLWRAGFGAGRRRLGRLRWFRRFRRRLLRRLLRRKQQQRRRHREQ